MNTVKIIILFLYLILTNILCTFHFGYATLLAPEQNCLHCKSTTNKYVGTESEEKNHEFEEILKMITDKEYRKIYDKLLAEGNWRSLAEKFRHDGPAIFDLGESSKEKRFGPQSSVPFFSFIESLNQFDNPWYLKKMEDDVNENTESRAARSAPSVFDKNDKAENKTPTNQNLDIEDVGGEDQFLWSLLPYLKVLSSMRRLELRHEIQKIVVDAFRKLSMAQSS